MLLLNLFEHLVDIGHMRAGQPEIDELRCSKDISMAFKRSDFTARYQQQLVEVWLQLSHVVVLRDGVVIGEGDEVKLPGCCRLHGLIERTWHLLSRLAEARA